MSLLKKRKQQFQQEDYLEELTVEEIQTEPMGVETLEQKKQSVENCCDRITSANLRIEELKVEYQTVNAYLNDIQIIENLPKNKAEELLKYAKKVVVLDKDRRDFGQSMSKLSNKQYNQMRESEDKIKTILKEMREDEQYCQSVKTDMRILEGERNSLEYEKVDMKNRLYLLNNASKIGILAFIVLVLVLLMVNYGFHKDTSLLLYITVGIATIFTGGIFILQDSTRTNLKLTEMKLNRAIGLLNKMKLKYVNVVGRLEYEYDKNGVKSAYQLNKVWGMYLQLKKEHEVYKKASVRLMEAEDGLVALLKNVNVKDANIWIAQAYAIVNKSDMQEIKTHLVNRRQRLKKSLDYNSDVIGKARAEIKEIVMSDKENAKELVGILDGYEEQL